ncbi:MAG: cytochrome P450, partial [Mesorhizobium sp.]
MRLLRRLFERAGIAAPEPPAAAGAERRSVDLTSPAFVNDPYPVWDWLRRNDPAHVLPNGALLLTCHADIAAALGDGRLVNRPSRFSAIGPRHRELRLSADVAANILPFMDGDEHRDRRKALAGAIRGAVASSDSSIQMLARDHAQRFAGAGGGDVLAEFATPFSWCVMTGMFGLPDKDGPDLAGWSDVFFRLFAPATSREALDETDAALGRFREYFLAALASADGDTLLAGLKRLADDGVMTFVEAADAAMLIYADGIENVDALMANALIALRDNPVWHGRLMDEPSLASAVVEETLRYDTPGQVIARIAAADCEIAGRAVRAEMPVLLALGSANRDETVWPDAGMFDPARRQSPQHLSFGAGRHGCLGARLVRMKATAALAELAAACSTMSVTNE